MAAPQIEFDSENQEPKPIVTYSTYTEIPMPSAIFSKDYQHSMVSECKLRMVGKFFKSKPKMTKIRVSFKAKNPLLKGVVKIKSYDTVHVFLDFTNEEDYDSVLLKEKVVVAGALMEVSRWTPQFHDQYRGICSIIELDNTKKDEHIGCGNEYGTKKSEAVHENPHIQKDALYISDSVDCVPEVTHSCSKDRVASHVNCETSEVNSSMEISCTGFSRLSSAPNGIAGRIPSVTYDSSSRCSADLVPSVNMNGGALRGTCLIHDNQKSYSRGWNYGSKLNSEAAEWWPCEALSQPLYALPIVEQHENQKSRPPMEVQYSTYTGFPTVTLSENYRESLVPNYKLTLIGNFFHRRPKMKEIRADFSAKNPLNGQVKIRACTCRQILLCFTNEEDYYTILYKKTLFVAGAVMQISWSPDLHHEVKQNIQPDFRYSDASPVNWNTDTSKLHPSIAIQNMIARSPYVMDNSSSTCSTYSIPPVVTDGPYRVTSSNHKNKEVVVSHRERPSLEMPNANFPPGSPPRSIGSAIQSMSKLSISGSSKLTQKSVTLVNSAGTDVLLNADPHKAIVPKAMDKPLVQSVSVDGRLCPDPSTATDSYVPQTYPNGIVGSPIFGRNEQAGRGSTFPSPSRALDQHILAQQHKQLNLFKEPNMIARIAQLEPPSTTSVSDTTSSIRYGECLKNHAASMGGHAVDGCGEFTPSGGEGTPGALKCAACNCHRNFHKKEIDDHRQMASIGSHFTFNQPRNNSSSENINNQPLISLPTQQLQQYSYSPSSVVNSSQSNPQSPSQISGSVFLHQGLERRKPGLIRPSYSNEMVDHDTMQNGQQREYSRRDSNRNISRDHPSIRNENWNYDMFKPLNNRTPNNIPSEFPACPSRYQSQSVFANEFPHLDIINNLLHEEYGTRRTLMPNSGFQSLNNGSHHLSEHFTYPSDIGMFTGISPSTSSCRPERHLSGL